METGRNVKAERTDSLHGLQQKKVCVNIQRENYNLERLPPEVAMC